MGFTRMYQETAAATAAAIMSTSSLCVTRANCSKNVATESFAIRIFLFFSLIPSLILALSSSSMLSLTWTCPCPCYLCHLSILASPFRIDSDTGALLQRLEHGFTFFLTTTITTITTRLRHWGTLAEARAWFHLLLCYYYYYYSYYSYYYY